MAFEPNEKKIQLFFIVVFVANFLRTLNCIHYDWCCWSSWRLTEVYKCSFENHYYYYCCWWRETFTVGHPTSWFHFCCSAFSSPKLQSQVKRANCFLQPTKRRKYRSLKFKFYFQRSQNRQIWRFFCLAFDQSWVLSIREISAKKKSVQLFGWFWNLN